MGIICGLIQPTSGQVCMYNFVLPGDVSYIHLLTGTHTPLYNITPLICFTIYPISLHVVL